MLYFYTIRGFSAEIGTSEKWHLHPLENPEEHVDADVVARGFSAIPSILRKILKGLWRNF
jgi:hypothetical protein